MIRYVKILILCIVCATLIYSCAKEFSDSNPFIVAAKGSLLDSSGGCLPSVVHGTYYNGVKTNPDSNYVQLIVHVASAGRYKIVSDTANGLIFKDSGFFYTTGYDTIHLKAEGTPLVPQTDLFSVTFDSTVAPGCSFEITVNDSTGRGNGSTGSSAVFALATASNACTNTTVNGSYAASVPLTTTNTIIVPVNVTTVGAYTLETNTTNGYKFSASGIFTSTGTQSVTLTGIGTPIAMGADIFKPQLGAVTGCSYIVNVAAAPAPAVFTLDGSPSACSNATVNGTYTANSALTSANTVTISANVTSIGAFSITTNTANGMTFSTSGIFTSTGAQPVTLTGNGTPATSGNSTFTPQGNSGCSFDISVNAAPVATGILTCKIDGVFTTFNDRANATNKDLIGMQNTLVLDGFAAPANGGNVPELQLFINNNNGTKVTTGTYNVDGFISPGYRIEVDYSEVLSDGSAILWNTSSSLFSPNPPFTIIITSITSSRIKGTFSGETTNLQQGGKKKITEGVFDLPVQ